MSSFYECICYTVGSAPSILIHLTARIPRSMSMRPVDKRDYGAIGTEENQGLLQTTVVRSEPNFTCASTAIVGLLAASLISGWVSLLAQMNSFALSLARFHADLDLPPFGWIGP